MAFLRQCLHEIRLRTKDPLLNPPMVVHQPAMLYMTENSNRTVSPLPGAPLTVHQERGIEKYHGENART